MKKTIGIILTLTCLISPGFILNAFSEDTRKDMGFFQSSLHYTTSGMAYWYDKANGGLETLTGIPYSSPKLDCLNCHVASCDTCHKAAEGEKFFYSLKAAQNQEICLNCHKRERTIMKIDKDAKQEDVHFARQMQCNDCHTARDVHGDGKEYDSMKQPGAIDAKCEKCHESAPQTRSHQVHKDRLECKACHVRHVVSCSNCHIETLVNERKRIDIKVSGWVFLLNYNGKVTSATTQTFVVPGNKTFLMFAPQNSHSIMKQGRKCDDCHGTEIVKKVQNGKLKLTWLENNELKNVKGVIPVADGVTYDCVYQDFRDGKWIPIENPPAPMIHYAGYGSPLSKDQLKKLAIPMGK
jgi:predicted CXXCH cytochrome family protein